MIIDKRSSANTYKVRTNFDLFTDLFFKFGGIKGRKGWGTVNISLTAFSFFLLSKLKEIMLFQFLYRIDIVSVRVC